MVNCSPLRRVRLFFYKTFYDCSTPTRREASVKIQNADWRGTP
ncbi:hypothetical protein HMPREF9554_00622 [Treponema phagedenis F0421]|nr:hypothetical protein HMPREF9554_00622 [Treponema phagedenis F0421]